MTSPHPIAVVTGGASGIGLATTEVLLDYGWHVVALDRDAKAIAAAREAIAHTRVSFAEADVTDEAGIEALVAAIDRDTGPIRGLVTSAGIGMDLPFLQTKAEHFRKIHDVNVVGTFLIARAVAERMRASGGGAIVSIASVSGLTGNIGRSAYGASKGAIVNLTRIMAVELARYGIRVNGVAPGPIETPMVASVHTADVRKEWYDRVLLNRYGQPREIAEAVAFLLDEKRASYITGQVLAVDGGFMAAGLVDRARG